MKTMKTLKTMKAIEITTPDGTAPTFVWDNEGASILVLMDGIGMRPAIRDVAAKIADHGYRVVMPDLFYRLGPYTAPEPASLFSDPGAGKVWFGRIGGMMTTENVRKDLGAYLDYIAVPRVGVVGYCMGGRFAIVAAADYPDRVAAAAAYHPGGLVTDKLDSPHLLAPKIRAQVYVGGAKNDAQFTPAMKDTLAAALNEAGVSNTVEMYDAMHGWVPNDTPVHDEAATARHYQTMFALFDSALKA